MMRVVGCSSPHLVLPLATLAGRGDWVFGSLWAEFIDEMMRAVGAELSIDHFQALAMADE